MSGIRGIAKNLSSLFTGHVISGMQSYVLIPLFIHSYGTAGLGEWTVLSAAVAYLGTLDFGVTQYVNQDLTLRYQRGDMQGLHVQQSTALRLLLGIILCSAVLGLVAFHLPLQHWLRLDGSGSGGPAIASAVVDRTVYLLGLQALASILLGFINGNFMVVGRAHIGGYWSNVKNLLILLTAITCVILRTSFATIALVQTSCVAICLVGALLHLRATAPQIAPTLRYWDGASVGRILSQSIYFAAIYLNNFLLYQVPFLILQRGAGPVIVALFSIMRQIFSSTRLLLVSPTQALGPEVTTLFGRQDWPGLLRLYDYSERLIFSLIPIANIGALYLSPLALTLWLRKPQLFVPHAYMLLAAISIVISAKEHKSQFQFSTNLHKQMARLMTGSYVAMDLAWLITIPRFGLMGLLWTWLIIELFQLSYIVRLNVGLFAAYQQLELRYVRRLVALSVVALVITLPLLDRAAHWPLLPQAALALLSGLVLLAAAFPLFHLKPVLIKARARMQARFSSGA